MFGSNVRKRRIFLGMSQTALARAVGKEQQNIQQVESGVVRRPHYMDRLLEVLECCYEQLIQDDFDPSTPAAEFCQVRVTGKSFKYVQDSGIVTIRGANKTLSSAIPASLAVLDRLLEATQAERLSEDDLLLIVQIAKLIHNGVSNK